MRSENFYRKSLHWHFLTGFETVKQGYQAQQAVAFICEEFLGIRADARIDNIRIDGYKEQIISGILCVARLEFVMNDVYHCLRIKQCIDDNDILSVEEYCPFAHNFGLQNPPLTGGFSRL